MTTRIVKTFILLSILLISLQASNCLAEDTWLAEFEDICGQTENSGDMTRQQLQSLIERCDKLKPMIENSDNPQKKVYIFRLDKCKRLFSYAIEVGEKKDK